MEHRINTIGSLKKGSSSFSRLPYRPKQAEKVHKVENKLENTPGNILMSSNWTRNDRFTVFVIIIKASKRIIKIINLIFTFFNNTNHFS